MKQQTFLFKSIIGFNPCTDVVMDYAPSSYMGSQGGSSVFTCEGICNNDPTCFGWTLNLQTSKCHRLGEDFTLDPQLIPSAGLGQFYTSGHTNCKVAESKLIVKLILDQ